MKDGYLVKKAKLAKYLPQIKHKRNALLKEPSNEQSLMQQIKDIDQTLHHKYFSYFCGLLFCEGNQEKVAQSLSSTLQKQSFILQSGFTLWSYNISPRSKRLSTRHQTFEEKMINLSVKNVFDFDLKKYQMLLKNSPNRWNVHKRFQSQSSKTPQSNPLQGKTASHSKIGESLEKSKKIGSIFTSATRQNNSPLSQKKKQSRKSYLTRKVITQIEQCPEDDIYSKIELKKMLEKEKSVISIWLPPTAYPQFYGMFKYQIGSRNYNLCFIKKYFFFKHGLNPRFFNAIFQYISKKQDKYVESLQLITNKRDYLKIYQPIGWKLKSIDSESKMRIRFPRDR